MKLCIAGVDNNPVLKDFIRAHVELLAGDKICIDDWYPDFKYQGRTIRYFYSTRPVKKKLAKLLPVFIHNRAAAREDRADLQRIDALSAFFRTHDVDCVLAEFGTTGASITPAARIAGIPLVVHFHGHDAHRTSTLNDVGPRYRALFEYADSILVVSKFMMRTLADMGAPPDKLIYNPYGPRDKFYSLEPDYSPTFLAVGRFTDIKANYLTIAAFREAVAGFRDARLVMVGDGELLETCRTLTRMWGLEDRVVFTGAIPHSRIDNLFEQSCAFVQHSITPSYGDAEGTPVVILEAQAAALPVIATRHAGIPDVVVDGHTGFLVDEHDVSGMAARMRTLLENPALCRQIGAAARNHVRTNFNLGQHISRVQYAIDRARSSKHSTRRSTAP